MKKIVFIVILIAILIEHIYADNSTIMDRLNKAILNTAEDWMVVILPQDINDIYKYELEVVTSHSTNSAGYLVTNSGWIVNLSFTTEDKKPSIYLFDVNDKCIGLIIMMNKRDDAKVAKSMLEGNIKWKPRIIDFGSSKKRKEILYNLFNDLPIKQEKLIW